MMRHAPVLLISLVFTLGGCLSSSAGGVPRPSPGDEDDDGPAGGEGEDPGGEGEDPGGEGEDPGGEGEDPGGEGEGEVTDPPDGPVIEIRNDPYDLAPGSEEYVCFWFEASVPDGAGAIAFRPVGGEGVHHVVLFRSSGSLQPTRNCDGLEGDWTMLAGAGVGSGQVDFPDGVAMPIDDGDVFVLQLHMLNATGDTLSIQGGYDVTLTEPGAEYTRAGMYNVTTTNISIPPGTSGHVEEHACSGDLPDDARLFNLFPHMHELGRQFDIEIDNDQGTQTIYSGAWRFEDQEVVALDPEIPLGRGDTLRIRCTWDNATGRTVTFGLHTSDEMCGSAFYFYPATGDEVRCIN